MQETQSKNPCGALIQATVMGNITCNNDKETCFLHNETVRQERLAEMKANNVGGINNISSTKVCPVDPADLSQCDSCQ